MRDAAEYTIKVKVLSLKSVDQALEGLRGLLPTAQGAMNEGIALQLSWRRGQHQKLQFKWLKVALQD
jgi:hypothetical protein